MSVCLSVCLTNSNCEYLCVFIYVCKFELAHVRVTFRQRRDNIAFAHAECK